MVSLFGVKKGMFRIPLAKFRFSGIPISFIYHYVYNYVCFLKRKKLYLLTTNFWYFNFTIFKLHRNTCSSVVVVFLNYKKNEKHNISQKLEPFNVYEHGKNITFIYF